MSLLGIIYCVGSIVVFVTVTLIAKKSNDEWLPSVGLGIAAVVFWPDLICIGLLYAFASAIGWVWEWLSKNT